MKKLSNTEVELQKASLIKKREVIETDKLIFWTCLSKVQPQGVA